MLRGTMLGSIVVYAGLIVTCLGMVFLVKPGHRAQAAAAIAAGVAVVAMGLLLPAPESRVSRVASRLDEFVPAWQFHEVHTMHIAAPPGRVFDAIRRVRADEIAFFRALTWIRRGGRNPAPGILNPGTTESLIDVATRTTFLRLVDDAPRELVIGTVIAGPRRTALTPELFQTRPARMTLAAMNFAVTPDGAGGSFVSTETRVYAGNAALRRRFAAYWRVIYPGSALIRRMWLRAVERRALAIGADAIGADAIGAEPTSSAGP